MRLRTIAKLVFCKQSERDIRSSHGMGSSNNGSNRPLVSDPPPNTGNDGEEHANFPSFGNGTEMSIIRMSSIHRMFMKTIGGLTIFCQMDGVIF